MGGEGGDGARSLGFVWGGKNSGVPGIKQGASGCLEATSGTTIRGEPRTMRENYGH